MSWVHINKVVIYIRHIDNMSNQMNEIPIIYGNDVVLVDLFLNKFSFFNLMHKLLYNTRKLGQLTTLIFHLNKCGMSCFYVIIFEPKKIEDDYDILIRYKQLNRYSLPFKFPNI